MNSYMLVSLLGLILAAMAFAIPVDLEANTLTTPVSEETTTVLPPDADEDEDYEDSYEPVSPDDDEMEAAEMLVFRPLFSYRRVEQARRRNSRRNQRRRYAPVYW